MKIWYDNFFFCPFNYTYLLRSSWAIVRNLQKMFEKCSEMFVWPLEQFRKIFRTSENGQKWCHQHTYIIKEHYMLHVAWRYEFYVLVARYDGSCHLIIKFISSRHRVISSVSLMLWTLNLSCMLEMWHQTEVACPVYSCLFSSRKSQWGFRCVLPRINQFLV